MIPLLIFLWLIRTTKAVLFWFYLWQLKEYHIGRFLDHFRTHKGRKLLVGRMNILKLFLFVAFFPLPLFTFFIVYISYIFEAVKTSLDFLAKRVKKPVLTKKTILLIILGLLAEFSAFYFILSYTADIVWIAFFFLIFDILTPLIISLIVLLLQPIAVLGRNRIIRRAIKKRERLKDLLVIGITGSYGKTSTKDFLAAILSEKFKVLKTKEHQNSEVGVSQCILDDLKEEHEVFVCEMGAYNKRGIKLLCDITKPKIGILTGVNEQHMATFGSLENIIKTKYELIESLPADGAAFFNIKNKYCLELYEKTNIKKFLYGKEATFPGEENILGAIAVARELGMTEEEINSAVRKIENRMPGIQTKEGINGLKIIDATYSSNPDGIMAHLEYIRSLPGKKVIVMPCLIELGRASKEIHLKIGKKIADVCDLAIITTKDRFKEMKEGGGEKVLFLEKPGEIFEKIKSFTKEGDVVILESRVPGRLISLLV